MDAAERIEAGLPIPAHLEAIFVDGTALGGARPKASVRDEHGVLWLAKFSSRKDKRHTRRQCRVVQADGLQRFGQQ